MKYKINNKYTLEAANRQELLEAVVAHENIKIEEVRSTAGEFITLLQGDSRWREIKLGESDSKMKDYGCVVTSISMLSYWYGDYKDPGLLAKELKFTSNGLLLWNSMNSVTPMKFVYRYYSKNDLKIQEILKSKDGACILQVNNKKHWVVLVGYSRTRGYKIADPFYGDICYLKDRYPNITGFAEVTRKI